MMGKKEFLSDLEKALSVLQEDELRDIISEYEQHIDIKVEKGLTEEEAIADFGSLQELTGEILEAYHVRVDYASATGRSRKKQEKSTGQEERESLEKLKQMGQKGRLTLWGGLKRAGKWLKDAAGWGWRHACRPFTRIRFWMASLSSDPGNNGSCTEFTDGFSESEPAKKGRRISLTQRRKRGAKMTGEMIVREQEGILGSMCRGIGRTAGRIWNWGTEAVLWGMRLMWNGFWIMISILAGGCGLFSLFAAGVLTVLLIQGYPLAGVTIGCAGLVCCLFSAAGLGMTLLWRREREEETAGRKEKEEQYPAEYRRRVYRPGYKFKAENGESEQSEAEYGVQGYEKKGDGQDA